MLQHPISMLPAVIQLCLLAEAEADLPHDIAEAIANCPNADMGNAAGGQCILYMVYSIQRICWHQVSQHNVNVHWIESFGTM